MSPKWGEAFEAFEAFRSSSDCVDLICSLCEFRSRVASMHWPEKKADSSRGGVSAHREGERRRLESARRAVVCIAIYLSIYGMHRAPMPLIFPSPGPGTGWTLDSDGQPAWRAVELERRTSR